MLAATPVSIYNSSSAEQIEYLCNDAQASIAIVEHAPFFEAFSTARPNLNSLGKLGIVNADGVTGADFTYAELLAHEPLDLAVEANNASPDDLATLIYTSETTGPTCLRISCDVF